MRALFRNFGDVGGARPTINPTGSTSEGKVRAQSERRLSEAADGEKSLSARNDE